MPAPSRKWLAAAALLIALATLLGAFGSHSLQGRITPDRLDVWRTAVDYHFLHALGLLGLGLLIDRHPASGLLRTAAGLVLAGLLIFSGTIYLSVLGAPRWINFVTPVGGLMLMLAWALAAVALWRAQRA
ncbi:MAG TPA: DUF423 domain-containing protein [Steroidobacteraceae bacterium]|nr:DUF423 domain-containing protein [Steroidobacteraceae bacterium]